MVEVCLGSFLVNEEIAIDKWIDKVNQKQSIIKGELNFNSQSILPLRVFYIDDTKTVIEYDKAYKDQFKLMALVTFIGDQADHLLKLEQEKKLLYTPRVYNTRRSFGSKQIEEFIIVTFDVVIRNEDNGKEH